MLIRNAEIEGRRRDIRITDERITAMAGELVPDRDERTIDARGGTLLPGLHDHHLHLFALAAAHASVACGPPQVSSAEALSQALTSAESNAAPWLRGVGYHDSVAGPLNRDRLDALGPNVPIRIQHQSGALWGVNSLGAEVLGLDAADTPAGVEKAADGRATGRLFRLDGWMRERMPAAGLPSLAPLGALLSRHGVTSVTDASPDTGERALTSLQVAVRAGDLPQRITVMGNLDTPALSDPHFDLGPVKILLDEATLPDFDTLCGQVAHAHRSGRAVAVHCVTRTVLVFTLAALREVGSSYGDRIEHASVAPPDTLPLLRSLGVTVVTQPNFIAERGDRYRADVDAGDLPWLYRLQGFLDHGIPLGGGTDAPYGNPDPWAAMRAAVERTTESGLCLSPAERLTPERALDLFLTPAHAPGGRPMRLGIGARADLCLLRAPWSECRLRLDARDVAATFVAGRLVYTHPEAS